MKTRGSGILLHISSLPSVYGIGDPGPEALCFADFLSEAGQRYWQILPLTPTALIHHSSPYHSTSAFACNRLLISPDLLIQDGFLNASDLDPLPEFPADRVDYASAALYKERLFHIAYDRFRQKKEDVLYDQFCEANSFWLEDAALFEAVKPHFEETAWSDWPPPIRDRHPDALGELNRKFRDSVEKEKFLQYIFSKQWSALKAYCNRKNIRIIGDIPIYVNYDSADVWANPELFKLDEMKRPWALAGVPPDYFSETGQLWSNPLYNWDEHQRRCYSWWLERISRNLALYDFVRLDHFRGLVKYWEVPASEKTAVGGRWQDGKPYDFLDTVFKRFPCLPAVAEDLGHITADVREVLRRYELPGIKVLLFAFGDDFPASAFLPHNLERHSVAYTGTHDNNTVCGWFETEATPEVKKRLFHYIGREVPVEEIHWECIRLLMRSAANTVILPMQDVLGLGAGARMNRPATVCGNWQWRLNADCRNPDLTEKLQELVFTYERG